MAWLTGWTYRKSHVINAQAGAGTNYQKRIVVHYGAGVDSGEDVYCNSHSQTDFDDIRFTDDDGSTELDYYLITKTDSNVAYFWVEIADDLSSSNATIYVYYGNAGVSSTSSGANTFLIFDDFNRSDSDTVGNGWTMDEGNGDADIDTNMLKIVQHQNEYCHIQQASPALVTLAMEAKIQAVADSGSTWAPCIAVYWDVDSWVQWAVEAQSPSDFLSVVNDDGTTDFSRTSSVSIGTWYYLRLLVGSANAYYYSSTDGVTWTLRDTLSRPSDQSGNDPSLVIVGKGYSDDDVSYNNPDFDNDYSTAGNSGTSYYDDVFVRKWQDTEPAHSSWGSEETQTSIPVMMHHYNIINKVIRG